MELLSVFSGMFAALGTACCVLALFFGPMVTIPAVVASLRRLGADRSDLGLCVCLAVLGLVATVLSLTFASARLVSPDEIRLWHWMFGMGCISGLWLVLARMWDNVNFVP